MTILESWGHLAMALPACQTVHAYSKVCIDTQSAKSSQQRHLTANLSGCDIWALVYGQYICNYLDDSSTLLLQMVLEPIYKGPDITQAPTVVAMKDQADQRPNGVMTTYGVVLCRQIMGFITSNGTAALQ